MTRLRALLVPNPDAIGIGVPIEIDAVADGTAPDRIEYDGSPYRRSDGLGPRGEHLYELLE